MDTPDDDIQFDLFDEDPQTVEAPFERRVRLPQRTGRRPVALGPAPPARPVVRLLLVVVSVLVIVLVLAWLIASWTGASRRTQYGNYMSKVDTIAAQSTLDGKHTVSTLTSSGLTMAALAAKLRTIAGLEQQNLVAAEGVSAPGRLRTEHAQLLEALQLRVSGVDGLATAFQNAAHSKVKDSTEAAALSQEAYRLLASDVIWDDLFMGPANSQIAADGVRQVSAPESHFLANPDLIITEHAMALMLQRIAGTSSPNSTPTGLHGTNIVSVAALPHGAGGASQVLSAGTLNTVTTSSSLVFKVTIHDGGVSQETQIPVTLTIGRPQSQGGPITKTEKLQLIDPGSDASVTFSDLGQVPFASQTTVSVDVAKVPGETNVANNSAQYNVIFSLPA